MRSGFARVATREEIRAKEGNLSIPLYVASQKMEAREERAGYESNGLPQAITAWLASSAQVRASLQGLFRLEKTLIFVVKRLYFFQHEQARKNDSSH